MLLKVYLKSILKVDLSILRKVNLKFTTFWVQLWQLNLSLPIQLINSAPKWSNYRWSERIWCHRTLIVEDLAKIYMHFRREYLNCSKPGVFNRGSATPRGSMEVLQGVGEIVA